MAKNKHLQNEEKQSYSAVGVWTLYFISIICGAALMALEIAGGRLLSPFFGSSVYVWGSVISVFLIALSTGYYYGGSLADRRPNLETMGIIIGISGVLVFVIPFVLPVTVNFSFDAGMSNFGALFVAMVLFFPPSVALGMISPYVVKLGVLESEKVGRLVGKFYSVSTFGSIIGTLGMTFVLTPLFGVHKVIYAMGIVLLLLTVIIFLIKKKYNKTLVCILLLIGSIITAVTYKPPMALSVERGRLIYEKESLYNNLGVVDGRDGLRYLLFNETEQSIMDPNQPQKHMFPYTNLMTAAANYYRPSATKELLIGLGGGTIPKYTYAKRPKVDMDTVEIDPEVVKVAKQYFYLQDNERIHNFADDGRMFLKDKQGVYDAVLVDAYNRAGIPYHLTTKEFFQELKRSLKPNGIAVFNVVSGVEGDNGLFFKSLLKTSGQVFKNWKLYFAYPETDLGEINNLILVISDGDLKGNKIDGFEAFNGTIDVSDSIVLTDDYAPVDNLMASVLQELSNEYAKLRAKSNGQS